MAKSSGKDRNEASNSPSSTPSRPVAPAPVSQGGNSTPSRPRGNGSSETIREIANPYGGRISRTSSDTTPAQSLVTSGGSYNAPYSVRDAAQEGARQADARQTALDVRNKRQAAKARAAPGDRAIHKVTRNLAVPDVRKIDRVDPSAPQHDPYKKAAPDPARERRAEPREARKVDKRPHCNKRPDRSNRGGGGSKGWRPWC